MPASFSGFHDLISFLCGFSAVGFKSNCPLCLLDSTIETTRCLQQV
jgi:hypothetical protein